MEDVKLNADEDDSSTKASKERLKSFHLFNCDKTYNLDAVENFLLDVKDDISRKLSLDIQLPICKNYFGLSKMSEMCEITIPSLHMDFAIFVVHAHESRLSINEDNAGIGYAKIYRALLKATDGKVFIVIGGDDNYKDENEKERSVISRWAKRKVSSQFQEEFLDGRKSFIFSWNKQHRAIHKEALLHYLDPNKKGKKFEYQPTEVVRRQEHEAENSETNKEDNDAYQEQEVEENGEINREPLEMPVIWRNGAENKRDDDPGMPNEESQPHSLVDFDYLSDREEEFVVLDTPEVDNTEVERVTNNITDSETLLMKTRLRYGKISHSKHDLVVWKDQWSPPDELQEDIANKFEKVALADLEIYSEEETGKIHVIITTAADYLVIYAVIEFVHSIITWIVDNVRYYIQWAVGSQPEQTELEQVDNPKEEFEMVNSVV